MHSFPKSGIASWVKRFALLMVTLACGSCRTGIIRDPNDVATSGTDAPMVIQAQLRSAAEELNQRKAGREITDSEYHSLMANIAKNYVEQANDRRITDQNASSWGDVLITAEDWQDAEKALERAVKVEALPSKSDYRSLGIFVTDNLRLARVKAELGKVREAVAIARSTFKAPGKAKAPVLPAVLYEIVPAGRGKGDDAELAQLLIDAIGQHQEVLVDPNTDAGRDFLLARPHHIQRARESAAALYHAAGRDDLAADAIAQARNTQISNIRL